MRGPGPIRTGLAAACAAALIAAAGADPGAGARGRSAAGPLEVLKVDPNAAGWTTGKVRLRQGRAYTLKISGTVSTASGPTKYDALYEYDASPSRSGFLRLQTPGYTSAYSTIDAFQRPKPDPNCQPSSCAEALPYSPDHTYTVRFYPPTTGPLEAGTGNQFLMQYICGHCYTATSEFKVAIYAGASSSPPPRTATLTGIKGKVEVQLDQGAWQTADGSLRLKPGDRIHTGWKSSVTIVLPDGSSLKVAPMTLVSLDDVPSAGGPPRTRVGLKLGEVKAEVARLRGSASDFQVRTPTTTASVRGTEFTVFYDPIGKASIVSTQVHTVSVAPVRRGAGSVLVPAGREVEVSATGTSALAPPGQADAHGGIDRLLAVDDVLALMGGAVNCRLSVSRSAGAGAQPAGRTAWQVIVPVQGRVSGSSSWLVTQGRAAPQNALARTIAAGC